MAFIGNTPTQQAFTPAVDVFSGNGSTTAFTLSRPVASVAQVEAVIENVQQSPVDAYTVSGNTITFTSAPPSGSSNIYVRYTSPITQVIAPGDGSVGTGQLANGAVTTAKIADANITTAKLADGSVNFAKLLSTDWTNTSTSASGYQKLPSGLIIQWGTSSVGAGSGSSATISFPLAFPNNVFVVNPCFQQAGATPAGVSGLLVAGLALANFTVKRSNYSNLDSFTGIAWVAIGY